MTLPLNQQPQKGYWDGFEPHHGAVDLEDLDFTKDHLHPPHLLLRFNDKGTGPAFNSLRLPTLIADEQAVQHPIEGDTSAVACPRQLLKLSHVLQLREFCTDAR